jgi:LacI family transcriptional regulator
MTSNRITSQDVADRAGVSRTTVSFVLNGNHVDSVSEPTRQRVLRIARDLGYVPHAAARSLAGGKSGTIGLVVNDARTISVDVFVALMLHGLHDACREHTYRLLLETAEFDETSRAYERLVRAKQIDALVVLNPDPEDAELMSLIESGYPVALVGAVAHPQAHLVVCEASPTTVYQTTSHLLALGHRQIAFIHFAPVRNPEADPRYRGYCEALRDAGAPFDERRVRFAAFDAATGYEQMRALLASGVGMTALVAGNDTIAIGALTAIHEAGLRVPEDIAVIGHDDIPVARFVTPALSTMRVPAEELGRQCGEMVIRLLNGEHIESRKVVLPPELIIRQSCGAQLVRIPPVPPAAD